MEQQIIKTWKDPANCTMHQITNTKRYVIIVPVRPLLDLLSQQDTNIKKIKKKSQIK